MTTGSDALGFREECLLLQLPVGGQDRAYSFRNARNRKDAAQRLQRFVHWEVSFEVTFYRRFAVLALTVHELRHRSKTIPVYVTTCSNLCRLRSNKNCRKNGPLFKYFYYTQIT
jgi:hypothetical protein